MLIKQLKEEEDGLVNCNDYQTVLPEIDYSLIWFGYGKGILETRRLWRKKHKNEMSGVKSKS